MPDSRLEIVGDEFLTSIDYYDEFHVNLLFDRSIYRPMYTHMDQYTELTLEKKSTSNASDDVYECRFENSDDGSQWEGRVHVYLFIVTPHSATVKSGESATLSCVMTG